MVQIGYNAVHAQVFGATTEEKVEIHRLLSVDVENSTGNTLIGLDSSRWTGQTSFFSFDKGTFPAGFVHLVTQGLQKFGSQVRVQRPALPEPLGPEFPEVDEFGYTPRYDYQPRAVEQLVRHGQITVQVATGGGKSRIARMALKRIDRRSLFLTTRGILMHQMQREIEKMEGECAILGDGEWGIPYTKPDGTEGRRLSKFCVGMVQTLAQRLEPKTVKWELQATLDRNMTALKKKVQEYKAQLEKEGIKGLERANRLVAFEDDLKSKLPTEDDLRPEIEIKVERHEKMRLATQKMLAKFELVIVEEAHEVSSNSFYAVMECCTGAYYRMAVTATPFMREDEAANMRLMAACGPVAIQISEQTLIERGILARPFFKILQVPADKKPALLTRSTPWQRAYTLGIVEHEYRNKMIAAELIMAKRFGLNAMVLVQHKTHGRILKELLTKYGLRCEFIFGEDNQKARDKAIKKLATGEIDVLIGSTILDVGVDVPSVGLIVLAGGGKAEVATRQRIGRGLREKKGKQADGSPMPNFAFIVDVNDDANNYLQDHALQRLLIIQKTPGFAENIVKQFDYEALGFNRI
ncbi:hypothetical protein ATN89_17560 [Comamonas thiooxydans]|uniref:DEAD/DEAH box helicase n=1 Tax=Comamonas thiooxydans TaxID=363952 RepID=UPI0007C437BD|nr:helicase-related protein [Comamonas thiooxydans]OAD82889.1 hypothetical protein ATN89_17560 [Comamonas thiooxydans]